MMNGIRRAVLGMGIAVLMVAATPAAAAVAATPAPSADQQSESASSAEDDSAAAEQHLRAAVAAAQSRDALALELRAAADLRRLELTSGETLDAARLLRSVVERFTEGHQLPDLRDALGLLESS